MTTDAILLLPTPRNLTRKPGVWKPKREGIIATQSPLNLSAAINVIRLALGNAWDIGPAGEVSIRLSPKLPQQGYHLTIYPTGVAIQAHNPAAAFYAAHTLSQLLTQFPHGIPAMDIDDSPDFPIRGYMQDISRDKVPTMDQLYRLVDQLAALKYNQLQLYTEHTFAYRNHPQVWAQSDPMTAGQILDLGNYCKERFIDLVPNQNCFGHMERWLRYPKYEPLAECPEGFTFAWGVRHEKGFSLDPQNPASLQLVREMMDELLPNFESPLFNAGCDETFDLGVGKSKEACEKHGKERVYLDFILQIHKEVTKRGKQMQFWGDIILHKPELIPELPKDLIALNWGYDIGHPFEKETRAFAESGVPFYVCPGTSSWCSLLGRTTNCLANLKSAAQHGLQNGAAGYLNTDWGDIGHLQYLPVSYAGIAAGAAYSWCLKSNQNLDIPAVLSLHIFKDASGKMGQLACDLGDVYLTTGEPLNNGTRFFWAFVGNPDRKRMYEAVTPQQWDATATKIHEVAQRLTGIRMQRPDNDLILEEYDNAVRMALHGCRRGKWMLDPAAEEKTSLAADLREIIGRHRQLWISRNRVGGLQDSTARLELRLAEYR